VCLLTVACLALGRKGRVSIGAPETSTCCVARQPTPDLSLLVTQTISPHRPTLRMKRNYHNLSDSEDEDREYRRCQDGAEDRVSLMNAASVANSNDGHNHLARQPFTQSIKQTCCSMTFQFSFSFFIYSLVLVPLIESTWSCIKSSSQNNTSTVYM